MKTLQASQVRARRGRPSYSLIELLVTFSIISIIIGLLLPAVSLVFRSAQRTAKMNWYRQRQLDPTIGVTHTKTVRVLFIGNSLTYVNNLPRMVQALVESAGGAWKLEYEMIASAGATLEYHWTSGIALDSIRKKEWDFVVLSDQSTRPYVQPDLFLQYARLFNEEIAARGAITLFYLTPANKPVAVNQPRITAAYVDVARELKAEVAPVGVAWQHALQAHPYPDLYLSDGVHPTPRGTYLSACVFYASIFGRGAAGLTGTVRFGNDLLIDLEPNEARALQERAWRTVIDFGPQWMQWP